MAIPLFKYEGQVVSIYSSTTLLVVTEAWDNKLKKAWNTRKSPGTLGLKKFGPGKLWVEKVWA